MNILNYLVFGWKYTGSLLRKADKGSIKKVEKLSYVTHSNTEKWILGAKARRLARNSDLDTSISYTSNYKDLNEADAYFFLHPNIFAKSLQKNPKLVDKKNIVMFTHPVLKNQFSIKHRVFVLSLADKVIFLNKAHAKLMIDNGLSKDKTEIMHLASDAGMFLPHERRQGKVCLSMAYYERKNPELMFDVIKQMPHRDFLLIGPQWEAYAKMDELLQLPNFEHQANPAYETYPQLYSACDVFFSPSHLEGGPVPLLETMLCNMVPVASRTGYCIDIIKHGINGFLFDSNSQATEVIPLIEQAFELKSDIRASVIDFTWEKYSKKIDKLFYEI